MEFSTTEGKAWIVNTREPSQRLEIQFDVRELSFDRSIQANDIKIIGRNNPIYHYTGGATELSFALDFYANDDDLTDVMKRIKLVESWSYNDSYKTGLPALKLIYGDLFKDESVWILSKCSYKLEQFDKAKGMLPKRATMNISLSLESNKKASEVRKTWN